MSDRYYQQMRDTTGWAFGMPEFMRNNKKYRRRKMAWTDESKEQAVEMYQDAEPTPETSMEIVKDIAEELGESPNGVRMILTKAGVYVKKTPAVKSSSGGTGGGRVNVAAAQDGLTKAIADAGEEADSAIVSKLTGKAAVYFTNLINKLND